MFNYIFLLSIQQNITVDKYEQKRKLSELDRWISCQVASSQQNQGEHKQLISGSDTKFDVVNYE